MGKTYSEAESLENMAGNLISTFHSELATARIYYVFVSQASKKGGQELIGKVRKVSGFLEWYMETDFIIEVAEDKWAELDGAQRTAALDHLLESCTGEEDEKSGEMVWSVREPDVHEFSSILLRHGAWNDQLKGFVSVAKNVNLEGFVEEESEVNFGDEVEQVSTTEV